MYQYSSYPGLLPTPNTPILQNKDVGQYIKASSYPIPFQASTAVEYTNVTEVSSWDIQVSLKTVKIKIDWHVGNSSRGSTSKPFPDAVLKAISTYDLYEPSWSSAFANSKFVLRVEWKISSADKAKYQPNSVPDNAFITPASKSTTKRKSVDSGYNSTSTNNVNKSRARNLTADIPRTKLFHSPTKNTPKHDIFRPVKKSSVGTQHCETSKSNTVGFKPLADDQTINNYTASTSHASNSQACHESKMHETLPVHESATEQILSQSSSSKSTNDNLPEQTVSKPVKTFQESSSIHDNTEDTPEWVGETPQFENSSFLEPESFQLSNINPASISSNTLTIIPTNPKFVVSGKSRDDNIETLLDPAVEEFDAQNGEFLSTPENIAIDPEGFIDQNLQADRMNIMGKCRSCNAEIPSYKADFHLLECPRVNPDIIDDFVMSQADAICSDNCEITNILYNYCDYVMHDDELNDIFRRVSDCDKFFLAIEQFLDRTALYLLKRLKISGPHKRLDILHY